VHPLGAPLSESYIRDSPVGCLQRCLSWLLSGEDAYLIALLVPEGEISCLGYKNPSALPSLFECSDYCYTQCYYINFIHMTKDTAGFLSPKQRTSPSQATKLVNKYIAAQNRASGRDNELC
jgi:hypothetical protein